MPNVCHEDGAMNDTNVPIPNAYPRNGALIATRLTKRENVFTMFESSSDF